MSGKRTTVTPSPENYEGKSTQLETAETTEAQTIQPQTTYILQVIFKGLCAIVPGKSVINEDLKEIYEGITVLIPKTEEKSVVDDPNYDRLPNRDKVRRGDPKLEKHYATLNAKLNSTTLVTESLNEDDLRITVGTGNTALNGNIEFYRGGESHSLDRVVDMKTLYQDEKDDVDKKLKVLSDYMNPAKLAGRIKLGGIKNVRSAELAAYSEDRLGTEEYYFRDSRYKRLFPPSDGWSPRRSGMVDGVIFTLILTEPHIKLESYGKKILYEGDLLADGTLTIKIENTPINRSSPHDNGLVVNLDLKEHYHIDYDFLLIYGIADLNREDGRSYKPAKIPRVDPNTISSLRDLERVTEVQRMEVIERTETIEIIEIVEAGEKIRQITTNQTEVKTVKEPIEKKGLQGKDEHILARPLICNVAIFSGE